VSDDPQTDVVLLHRIAARDNAAVAELYDRHNRLLYGLILRILRNRDEAEDVLQEVFVTIWTRAGTYDMTLGSPLAWLVRVARNRAIDRLRSRQVADRALDSVPLPLSPAGDPETGAAQRQEQETMARALAALPGEQRTLIEHAFYLGWTHAELASRFELPLGTVKTRIRRGMMALRDAMQKRVVVS
jgi:RNA polymerase sigma-70 factor (ECF subfamily)